MVQYFATCKRELWFFSKGINQNYQDENILIGRWLQEKSYQNEKKGILIDNTINIDFLKEKEGLVVHEIKKSSRLPIAVNAQILYYLWYLKKKKGVKTTGVIVYPKEKKRVQVTLTKENEEYIEEILEKIPSIVNANIPPKAVKKSFCKNCSYFEFCWC